MNEHTQAMLEFTAIVMPVFLAMIGGLIAIYSRLTRIETMVAPVWEEFVERNKKTVSTR